MAYYTVGSGIGLVKSIESWTLHKYLANILIHCVIYNDILEICGIKNVNVLITLLHNMELYCTMTFV